MNKELNNEQLWELCTEYVTDTKATKSTSTYEDKAVDWDYQRQIFEQSRNLK